MGFQDLSYAQQMRDIIRNLAAAEINRLRPASRLGTVTAIDSVNKKASVLFPGDTESVQISMYSIRPTVAGAAGVGDVVRVAGSAGRRYVADVVSGIASFVGGTITLSALKTTGTSANLVVDTITGEVFRSTSSQRYKKNIQPFDVEDHHIMQLNPVAYQDIDSDLKYLGLIAESIDEIDDPILDLLIERNKDGEPDSLNYDRLAVVLLPVIKRLLGRVADLENELSRRDTGGA